MTREEIAANNAAVLAARDAAERKLRERLAPMKGTVLVRRKGGRPKGGRNWDHFDPDEPRKIYVKAGTSKKLSDEAKRSGITVSLLVEVMVDSYLTAPAEHRMLAEVLHAVKKYEKEAK